MINRTYTKKRCEGRCNLVHEVNAENATDALAELYRLGMVSDYIGMPTDRDENDEPRVDKYPWICSLQGQGVVTFATEEEASKYVIDDLGDDISYIDNE